MPVPLLLPEGVGLQFVREHDVIVMQLWPEVVQPVGDRQVLLHVVYAEGVVGLLRLGAGPHPADREAQAALRDVYLSQSDKVLSLHCTPRSFKCMQWVAGHRSTKRPVNSVLRGLMKGRRSGPPQAATHAARTNDKRILECYLILRETIYYKNHRHNLAWRATRTRWTS